jgi:NAD(P)-dependent dehydrogenase (short-subunit alcohol dehydrogenase family)
MNRTTSLDTIFISGGTSGLGFQTAEHFVSSGASVIICGRNSVSVGNSIRLLNEVARSDQSILGFTCDVADAASVSKMFAEINQLGISVQVLICNAGVIGPIDEFLENDLTEWQNAFSINLYGTLHLVAATLPRMLLSKKGRVIHISGGGATSPLFGMSSYAASKAAAVRFIETVALEYKDSGITFNSVAPGMLKTKLLDQMLEAGPDRIGENLFNKSSAKADASSDSSARAIELIDFLSSEASAGITGKLISAQWDNWSDWPNHLEDLEGSDLYTLRRITGRDRGQNWGDL